MTAAGRLLLLRYVLSRTLQRLKAVVEESGADRGSAADIEELIVACEAWLAPLWKELEKAQGLKSNRGI